MFQSGAAVAPGTVREATLPMGPADDSQMVDFMRGMIDEALEAFRAAPAAATLSRPDRLFLDDLAERVRQDREISDDELRVAHATLLSYGFDPTHLARG
jgi:uncharacterized protein with von Willebrand factor type A (vWA) domain